MKTFLTFIFIVGALLVMLVNASALLAAPPSKTPPRFVDNGDGTVTDNQTGLMWEKKTQNNWLDTYAWSSSGTGPDGTLFTSFLPFGNCVIGLVNTGCGLFGHYDWRLPNLSELKTIVDCSKGIPCIDPILGPMPNTVNLIYWSATTDANNPYFAIIVNFYDGSVAADDKTNANLVRVVRGGRP